MADQFLYRVADLLEKVAEQFDQEHRAEATRKQQEQRQIAASLQEKVASTTGDSIPSHIWEKIASSDSEVVDAVIKLAERHVAPPEELGEPGDIRDGQINGTLTKTARVKEAHAEAESRLLDWIMS